MNKTPYLIATALLAIATGTALAQAGGGTAPAAPVAERKPLDANQDGVIDRSEAAAHPRLAARFDELDKNGDGKLDASEQPRAPMDRKGHRGPGGHGCWRGSGQRAHDGHGGELVRGAPPRPWAPPPRPARQAPSPRRRGGAPPPFSPRAPRARTAAPR